MVTLNTLKEKYLFSDVDMGFAVGRRNILRFAVEIEYAYHTSLNSNGPEPFEYLDYAKKDIAKGDKHGAIDCISNAKRAIHLAIDNYFKLLGLSKAYSKANFPVKLEILELLNAFPTRLIESINSKRNLVEHEYHTVAPEEAIEFIDITEMFLLLIHPYLKHTTIGAVIGIQDDERCIEWRIEPLESEVQVNEIPNQCFIDSPVGKVFYNISFKEELERINLDTIRITMANRDKWLRYLDFFVFMTKYQATQMPKPDNGGKGMYRTVHSGYYV